MHDSATQCLCTLLQCIEANNNNQYDDKQLLGLENSYHTHVRVGCKDVDKTINYCRIFTTLGNIIILHLISNVYWVFYFS